MEFEFVTKLQYTLRPLGVECKIVERRQCFYLVADGTKTYEDPAFWNRLWGKSFNKVLDSYVRKYLPKAQVKVLTPTKVEYKIGNIMDILKQDHTVGNNGQ